MTKNPLETSSSYDFIIVGAGIAGASLAWHLARHGTVLLVERESQPGQHSTGRSAAMFMETYGSPQARALTRASRQFYESPPPGFADHPVLSPRGALYVGWEGQEAVLQEQYDVLKAAAGAHPVRLLNAEDTLVTVPVLLPTGLAGAVDEPDAMDIDVDTLLQGFLRGAKKQGANILTRAELLKAHFKSTDQLWHLTLGDGSSLQTRILVNAAGAWADECATRCGASALGLQPKRRSAFIFEATDAAGQTISRQDSAHWPTVAGIDNTWYFKPEAGLFLGSPANEDPVPAHDVQAEDIDIATAIANIEAHTSLKIRRPKRVWAGLRTFAPDDELVIGWDAQQPGLFWLAGQGGYGIQSAAGVAELATSLLLRLPLSEELAAHGVDAGAVAPRRFQPVQAIHQNQINQT